MNATFCLEPAAIPPFSRSVPFGLSGEKRGVNPFLPNVGSFPHILVPSVMKKSGFVFSRFGVSGERTGA